MYGYIIANKPELKIKEYEKYKSYYCGLCKAIKRRAGQLPRLSLSYDMTFVYIVLSSLYEAENQQTVKERCILHPAKKRIVTKSDAADYVADMSLFMTFLKGRDDWKDCESVGKSASGRIVMDMTKKCCKRIRLDYPKKTAYILSEMKKIDNGEACEFNDIDYMAGAFGSIMGEIFAMREDLWESTIRKMGFYLGKFIYLIDAYEDIERDIKTGNYNPLYDAHKRLEKAAFDDYVQEILVMMMTDCTREFEKLPIVEDAELIRNILYAGVWSRFKLKKEKIKDDFFD